MRYIIFMILITAFARTAIANDLEVKPTSNYDQLTILVNDQDKKIHRAHIIIKNENDLTIAEGETNRDGTISLILTLGQTLTILTKTPNGEENNQIYNHIINLPPNSDQLSN